MGPKGSTVDVQVRFNPSNRVPYFSDEVCYFSDEVYYFSDEVCYFSDEVSYKLKIDSVISRV